MVKKLNTIILLALIFILLVPLSARGQRGRGSRGGAVLPWGWFITELFGGSSHNTPNLTPADKSHGILQIKVEAQDVEIYIDGRFIGRARDFKGPAMVSVPSGKHIVEFKDNDSSLPAANVDVVPGSVAFIVK